MSTTTTRAQPSAKARARGTGSAMPPSKYVPPSHRQGRHTTGMPLEALRMPKSSRLRSALRKYTAFPAKASVATTTRAAGFSSSAS